MGSASKYIKQYQPDQVNKKPTPRANPLANSDREQATADARGAQSFKFTPWGIPTSNPRAPRYTGTGTGPIDMTIKPRQEPNERYRQQNPQDVLQKRADNLRNFGAPQYQFNDPMSVVSYLNAKNPIYAPLPTDRFGNSIPGQLKEQARVRPFNFFDTYGGRWGDNGYSEPPLMVIPGSPAARGMNFTNPSTTPAVADRGYDPIEEMRARGRGEPSVGPWQSTTPQPTGYGGGYPGYPGGGGGGGGGYSPKPEPWYMNPQQWRI